MDISTALSTHCLVDVASVDQGADESGMEKPANLEGDDMAMSLSLLSKGTTLVRDYPILQIVVGSEPPQSHRFEGLDTCIYSINRRLVRFKDSRCLPIRACRWVLGQLLSAALSNQTIVGFVSKRLDLNDRRSISRPYFQSLICSDDYEWSTDPIDVACAKNRKRDHPWV